MSLEIQPGKHYRTRNGAIVKALSSGGGCYPISGQYCECFTTWTRAGRYVSDQVDSPRDLIEQVTWWQRLTSWLR